MIGAIIMCIICAVLCLIIYKNFMPKNHSEIITGKDAKQFRSNLENPGKLDDKTRERIKINYEKIKRISKF